MSIHINRFVLGLLVLCSSACSGWKSVSCRPLTREETILYFIEKFSRRPGPLRGSDPIFLTVYDTVKKYSLVEVQASPNCPINLDAGFRWIPVGQYDGVSAIAFNRFSDYSDLLYEDDCPNRYTEAHGRLFFWRDGDVNNPEIIDLIKKEGQLHDADDTHESLFQPHINDDSKMIVFYFRKGTPRHYKRVINSSAIGYYPPPPL